MQVDEPGCDHQTRRIHGRGAGKGRLGHGRYGAVADTDVPHRIQPGLGVHDPPPRDDQIECLHRLGDRLHRR